MEPDLKTLKQDYADTLAQLKELLTTRDDVYIKLQSLEADLCDKKAQIKLIQGEELRIGIEVYKLRDRLDVYAGAIKAADPTWESANE